MATLSGKVTHQDSPVPFVNIFLKGTTLGTSTDVNGQFIIQDIPQGTYTVFISSIGFETLSPKVSLLKTLNVVSNFQLVENTSYLEEVVISGTMKEITPRRKITAIYMHLYKILTRENVSGRAGQGSSDLQRRRP